MSSLLIPARAISTFIFGPENETPTEKKTNNKQRQNSFIHTGFFVANIERKANREYFNPIGDILYFRT